MQDKDSQKNLLLAIVLSVSVLLAWQLLFAGPKLKEEQERRAAPAAGADADHPAWRRSQDRLRNACRARRRPRAASCRRRSRRRPPPARPPCRASARVPISTPSLRGSIALKGGRIDDLVLVKYRETVEPNSPNVVLFSPSGSPEPYYAEYGWVSASGDALPVPDRDTVWSAREGQHADARTARSRWPGTTARAPCSGARSRSTPTT